MKILMYGFSGQNTNIWIEYFGNHREYEVVFLTTKILPDTITNARNVSILTLEYKTNSNRFVNSLNYWYTRVRKYKQLRNQWFDLVIYQGMYNWADMIHISKTIKSKKSILILWNDLNHKRLANTTDAKRKALGESLLDKVDYIYSTWEPVREAFLKSFPQFDCKTRTMPWGIRKVILKDPAKADSSLDPEITSALEKNGNILLFWPRTIRGGIRHDVLFDALELFSGKEKFVTVLAMGKAQNVEWDNCIVKQLKSLQERRTVFAEYSQHLPLSKLQPLYRRADILVNLADTDQLSFCILEAIASRTEIILSNIPTYRYLEEMGFDIMLTDNEPVQVAASIRKLVSRAGTEESDMIKERNYQLYKKYWDLEKNITAIIKS